MRLLLPAPLLLLCAACATTLHTRDVANAFAKDAAALVERPPTKTDLDPARAANAPDVMKDAERDARDYLERKNDDSAHAAYVRGLLACALLAQGRPADARQALRWKDARGAIRETKARVETELTHENTVAACSMHATAVCRSVEAREAAEAFLEGKLPAGDFVRDYGSFAGLQVGAPDAAEREKLLKLAASELEASCAPGVAEPPAATQKARAEFLRVLSEQIYNDAASLLARLPGPPDKGARAADEIWLAKVAVKGVTIYRFLIPVMLPAPLSADQKAWQREQAFPVFKNARGLAAWFLSSEARTRVERTRKPETPDEVLYDRLLAAQLETLAWIDSR